MRNLFTPIQLGSLQLPHRIFMAPLTRCRADEGNVPSDLAVEYYRQRASAGLIITEATSVSPYGYGYPNTPGIFNESHIAGWRKVWNRDDMPFYYVQLAPYRYSNAKADRSLQLPGIWEAQIATLAVPHTGMAATTDTLGSNEITDIHPKNKQEVGKRLALCALGQTYGKSDLVYSAPTYKSMKVEGSKVRISFDHTAGGLTSRDGKPLTWFRIAGTDKKFVDAKAEIDGDTVVVSSESVDKPRAVRFAWNEEAQPNLANKEGLPAVCFRTDKP